MASPVQAAGGRNAVAGAGVEQGRARLVDEVRRAAPNDHLTSGPDRRMEAAAGRGAIGFQRRPEVAGRGVPAAVAFHAGLDQPAEDALRSVAAPNNHLASAPDRAVAEARAGRIEERGGRPAAGGRVEPRAAVEVTGEKVESH